MSRNQSLLAGNQKKNTVDLAGFILSMLVVIVILCILGDYIHDVIGC